MDWTSSIDKSFYNNNYYITIKFILCEKNLFITVLIYGNYSKD